MKPSRARSGRPPTPTRRRLTRWLLAVVGAATVAAGVYVAVPASAVTSQWLAVSAGSSHTCAISINTSIWCWGSNNRGQLGVGDFNDRSSPTQVGEVGAGGGWTVISAGHEFTCGIRNGYRYCWGAGEQGQLGLGGTTGRNLPRRDGGENNNWVQLDAGKTHVCGVRNNGAGQCWGSNIYGMLGSGDTINRTRPRTVNGGISWQSMTAGTYHSCGLDAAKVRYCWGVNDTHQLGLAGETLTQLEPVVVTADGTWLAIDAGSGTTCGFATTGRLYCWGTNTYGHAGVGNTLPQSDPPLVNSSSFIAVSSGGHHACAVRSNNTLYCWGRNEAGELGLGNTTDKLVETLLPSQSPGWTGVSAGAYHTCGIRTDKTLWCWGYNNRGQLGIGSTANKNTPQQVP